MIWALAIVLVANALFANPSSQIGKDAYGKETIESLEVLGTVKLNGTTISKSMKITGNLIAHSASLNLVDAIGDIQLHETTVAEKMQIIGSFRADRSTFQQPVLFSGQRAVFSACKLTGITIERDAAFKGKQRIELKDKTIVDGPIAFIGEGGEVLLYPGSKVYGPISGGKVVHKN